MVFSSVVTSFLFDQGHTSVKSFCQNWIFSTQKYAAPFVYFSIVYNQNSIFISKKGAIVFMNFVPWLNRVLTLFFTFKSLWSAQLLKLFSVMPQGEKKSGGRVRLSSNRWG